MEHGLKLKLSKCNFFHTKISYLGHKVSAAGMEPANEGLKGITEIAPPAMYTQVHKFLGATGYFRCFIKGYARITKPLNDLLQGENSKLKSHSLGLPPDVLAAFQELKMRCLTAPVLAFADFKKPFLLETDASIEGLGWCSPRSRMMASITLWPMPVVVSREVNPGTTPLSWSFWLSNGP